MEGASHRDAVISGGTMAAAQDIIGHRGTARQALADYRAWMREQDIAATNPASHYLAFVRTCAGCREARQLGDGKKLPFREQLSRVWWLEDLTEGRREAWREKIGRRFELPNGEGWMRGEENFASEAFGHEYPESRNATFAEIAAETGHAISGSDLLVRSRAADDWPPAGRRRGPDATPTPPGLEPDFF
ncbi:MAG: hypothetical protein OXN84_13300 [Albidovulum sp.]|nr:hypothetical protein [Albidovulum sp.]